MIKVVFCLRRRKSMTRDEFQTYWRNVHAPLVQKHRQVLRIKRYMQVHTDFGAMTKLLGRFRDAAEPYDGVAEIWYESREALERLGDDPAARAASRELLADEKRFIDLPHSAIWVGSEIEVLPNDTKTRGMNA